MHVGILAPGDVVHTFTQHVEAELQRRSIRYTVLTPYTCKLYTSDKVQVLDRNGTAVPLDVLITMLAVDHGLDIAEWVEAMGVPVVNTAAAWRKAEVKPLTSIYLTLAGVPNPSTMAAYHWEGGFVTQASQRYPLPVVTKPWDLRQGMGVARGDDWDTVAARLSAKPERPRLLQRYVKNTGNIVRVLVIGEKAVAAHYGGVPRAVKLPEHKTIWGPYQMNPRLVDISLRATRAIGLDFAALDLMEYEDDYIVIEVNAFPNAPGTFDRHCGISSGKLLLEHALNRARS